MAHGLKRHIMTSSMNTFKVNPPPNPKNHNVMSDKNVIYENLNFSIVKIYRYRNIARNKSAYVFQTFTAVFF
jgi:hypothetical protein